MEPWLAEAQEKLTELSRRRAESPNPSGWSRAYELNPPLPDRELRALERELGVSFPQEYRQFLTQLADGASSDDWTPLVAGSRQLRELLEEHPAALQRAFPWRETVLYYSRKERELQGDDFWAFVMPEGWPELRLDGYTLGPYGAIRFASLCCSQHFLLVTTGPERGNVWLDSTGLGVAMARYRDYLDLWDSGELFIEDYAPEVSGADCSFREWLHLYLDRELTRDGKGILQEESRRPNLGLQITRLAEKAIDDFEESSISNERCPRCRSTFTYRFVGFDGIFAKLSCANPGCAFEYTARGV